MVPIFLLPNVQLMAIMLDAWDGSEAGGLEDSDSDPDSDSDDLANPRHHRLTLWFWFVSYWLCVLNGFQSLCLLKKKPPC